MKAFYLSDQSKIQLKYMDFENDEITVNCDDDLIEAFNLYFMKNLIKFFVYYSGVFEKEDKLQTTGYSKIERPRSLTGIPEENLIMSTQTLNNTQSLIEKKLQYSKLKIDSQELQNIFSEVFSSTGVLEKFQDKLLKYIPKEENSLSEGIEYSIDTDYQAISEYIKTTLNDLINQKIKAQPIEEEKKEESKKRSVSVNNKKSLLDVSLSESIYGPSSKGNLTTSKSHQNSINQSISSSSIECKSLSSTFGVKLVLKCENGKAKFVSIPIQEYSIIEAQSNLESDAAKINENKSELIEEPKEKKSSEFSNKILKSNIHDLDDDLPAPYDKKVVQKFEQGLSESLYEKIE